MRGGRPQGRTVANLAVPRWLVIAGAVLTVAAPLSAGVVWGVDRLSADRLWHWQLRDDIDRKAEGADVTQLAGSVLSLKQWTLRAEIRQLNAELRELDKAARTFRPGTVPAVIVNRQHEVRSELAEASRDYEELRRQGK